jgi:uncharacterized membrane protein
MKNYFSLLLISLSLLFPSKVLAQDQAPQTQPQVYKAKILKVLPEEERFKNQDLRIKFLSGELSGQQATAAAALDKTSFGQFKVGQRVIVRRVQLANNQQLVVTDFIRSEALWAMTIVFVVAVIVISRKKGIKSLVSMGLSFVVITQLILPMLIQGQSPVLVSILGALIIIPLTFYLSHGIKKKTHVAVIGTLLALIFSGLLASLFVNNAHLSGYTSEEAGFLNIDQEGQLDVRGLLLAGIIIGLLGTLDDITITQSGLVSQLNKNQPKLSPKQLYHQAMTVGQDHIASMVNTLVLVYTGAALPLLMIFIDNPYPVWYIVNQEIVAEEIIRMLIGSVGLIFAAPLTTLLAVAAVKKQQVLSLVKFK